MKIMNRTKAELIQELSELHSRVTELEASGRDDIDIYKKMVKSITEPLFTINKELKCTYWNREIENLTGIMGRDALGKSLNELFFDTKAMKNIRAACLQAIRAQETQRFVNKIRIGDRIFFFKTAVYPVQDGVTILNYNITEHQLKKQRLIEAEERFRRLFEDVPISLWEFDFSAVKAYLGGLGRRATTDLEAYFKKNPKDLESLLDLVRVNNLNQATMRLFQAGTKEKIVDIGLGQVCTEDTYDIFRKGLVFLSRGHTKFEGETSIRTLAEENKEVYLTLSLAQGYEKLWSKVLVSVVDISESKKAEEELRRSREYLQKLNDSLKEVIFTLARPGGEIQYINRSVEHVFGYKVEECIGKTAEFLYHSKEEYQNIVGKARKAISEGKDSLHLESFQRRKDGKVFPSEITGTYLRERGEVIQLICVLRDISRRKLGEKVLRENETRLAEAQRIAHFGYWEWNIETGEHRWSDETYRIYGFKSQQFPTSHKTFLDIVYPEDRGLVEQSITECLRDNNSKILEYHIVWPDGSVRFVRSRPEVTYNSNGRPVKVFGTVHDITEQKTQEQKLRAFSHKLVKVQEEERRIIAHELHDQTGQMLTVINILLEKALRSSPENAASSIKEAVKMVNKLMEEVRDLSLNLHPPMLDDLGLLATLLWYFDSLQRKTQLRIEFQHSGLHRFLPHEINTTAYRIIQEALTNILRHAGVHEATVAIWVAQDTLSIRVEDKGYGFDKTKMASGVSSGLWGIRERAHSLGGKLTLESEPGTGTVVFAKLPISDNGGSNDKLSLS